MKPRLPAEESSAIDMTPMIDMTFQLIAFFMFVLNFSKDVADERIKLPVADRAVPIEGATQEPLWLNVNSRGELLALGERWNIETQKTAVEGFLKQERALAIRNMKYAEASGDGSAAADLRKNKVWSTVVIRADGGTPYRAIRDLMQSCQTLGFYKFTFRALPEEDA